MADNQPAREQSADAFTAEEMQQDAALEYESMVFLSKLEQVAIRLQDKAVQASAALALEHLVKLANLIVEFTENLPMAQAGKFSLEALITRDRKHYTQLGLRHIRNHRFAFEVFTELHMKQGALRHPNTFQQVSKDLLRVINICMSLNVKSFQTPTMREQWQTVHSGFLVSLVKTLQKYSVTQTSQPARDAQS